MSVLLYSLVAALCVSLVSLAGVLFIGMNHKKMKHVLLWMVSFAAGSLIGGAFFHLLPEALEQTESLTVFKWVIIGFVAFYLMERILRWHHCHKPKCETHKVLGYQNLFGDGVHNFIDGLIIVSSFYVDTSLGIAVTFSILFHEVPQEIGDFGVLLYSGFSKTKALLFNFASAVLAIAGVVVGYFLMAKTEQIFLFLLPFAAGGFIYIGASDLIPELHREKNNKRSLISFAFFVFAVFFMLYLKELQ